MIQKTLLTFSQVPFCQENILVRNVACIPTVFRFAYDEQYPLSGLAYVIPTPLSADAQRGRNFRANMSTAHDEGINLNFFARKLKFQCFDSVS